MRRPLQRTAQVLLTASVLGLIGPALAQSTQVIANSQSASTAPAAASVSAPARPKTAQVGYITTGVVVFDDELPPLQTMPGKMKAAVEPATTIPFGALPTSAVANLKQKIEAVCGQQGKVQVTVKPDKSLHVLVQVDDFKTQQALTNKILQLPEMATPNVHLEIEEMGLQ